ncbi:unnamed protein product [Auanema sp. JU1783]|nr:unnamed protein product [Auanema sp. JU1783]
MARENVWDRLWFKIFAASMLFFLCQLFLTFAKVQTFEEDKMYLKAEVESLERKKDTLNMDIMTKQRTLARMNKEESRLENLLRDRVNLLPSGRKTDPVIYFVTPTNFRTGQKADLTRLSYTLSHVPNLFWIVVEDSSSKSNTVAEIIRRSHLPYAHMNVETPKEKKMKYSDPNWYLPRGVDQRNAALSWLRTQLISAKQGVVYFGDDDNTYDLRLFEELRSIKKAGIVPVGIVGGLIVEAPTLASNGSVVGFNAVWKPERPFPIDMAAFAVNLTLITQNPSAGFKYDVPRGYQESQFLTSLGVKRWELEPKAQKCTKVYVWHTRTEKAKLSKTDIERVGNHKTADFESLEAEALGLE